ncbi:hypothetical protein NJR55_07335 [Idiomarina sp. M1R2S28]|uniref:Uncharacterized protein n=1 Tax=Idiomarina rhizosphaerae TaxID=2961572 RepID=A0A9X2JUY0_9GAMM|nr:hypothetical protein [Idiomarina rhizosphaerae]MCP1339406.1 hypothetical protein [Idiomarina rhizosphaerae]
MNNQLCSQEPKDEAVYKMIKRKYTIAELYYAVWSSPLNKLAACWQVDANGLGKLLDRHSIPRPKSGYWAQKALNKKVSVTPLPKSVSPSLVIDLTPLQRTKREKSKLVPAPLPKPTKPISRYPLLKSIKSSMSKPHYKYDFLMVQPYDNDKVMRLDVSPEQQTRAIYIFYTLLESFEKKGWIVKVEKHRYAKRLTNLVTINGEPVPFRLRERLKQQKRELEKKEIEEKTKYGRVWHEKINVPSGCLQLIIEGPMPAGVKGVFEDKPTLSLEQQLAHVMTTLEQSSEQTKVVRAEREAGRQRFEKLRLRREEHERRVTSEHSRIKTFLALFMKWQRARDCRMFLSELNGADIYQHGSQEQKANFSSWAYSVIDAIDPIVNGEAAALITDDFGDEHIFEEAMSRYLKSMSE